MPCETVTIVSLVLKPEIVRIEWLKNVIERFGNEVAAENDRLTWRTGSYDRKTGKLTERTVAAANKIRQNYAAELTKRTLGRAGWKVKAVVQGGR